MRSALWLSVVILILAAILGAAIAWSYLQPPWVQFLGGSVLRSNAPPKLLADAENAVVDQHRNYVVGADGKRSDPSASDRGQSWSTGTSPEHKTAEVKRNKIQITDKDGHRLAFERIESTGAPTLVFVEFDGPEGARPIVEELLQDLQKRGIEVK
jgi:hypothetical protein